MPFFEVKNPHHIKYIEDIGNDFANYGAALILNVFNAVAENLGVKNPEKLANKPKELQKASGLNQLYETIRQFIARKKKSAKKDKLKLTGKLLKLGGKSLSDAELRAIEGQIEKYLSARLGPAAEEMAIKGVLMALASSEKDAQGTPSTKYGKQSYEQVEREQFSGYMPDSLQSAKARFRINKQIERGYHRAYNRATESMRQLESDVQEAVRQQVMAAHRRQLMLTEEGQPKPLNHVARELASDLYWQKDDKPELTKYTAEYLARNWQRVAKTEMAMIHETGKQAATEEQSKNSLNDPSQAVYLIFHGPALCKECQKRLGTVLRQIPLDMVGSEGDDTLSSRGINDEYTNIATWQGKSNIGYKQAQWRVCTPLHPNCYSDDTEVLTNSGWKLFRDVADKDKIFSINPQTQELEFVSHTHYVEYHHNGDMINFSARGVDALVTPEHQMYIQRRVRYKKTKSQAARTLYVKELVEAQSLLSNNEFTIPRTGVWHGIKSNVETYLWAKLIGWYVAEGTSLKVKGNKITRVDISQSIKNERKRRRIRFILRKLNIKYGEGKACFTFYGEAALKIVSLVPGKSFERGVPQFIKDSDPKTIKGFLKEYMLGDGHYRKSKIKGYDSFEVSYFTTSKVLLADISELILKSGRSLSIRLDKASRKGTRQVHKNGVFYANHDCYTIAQSESNGVLFSKHNSNKAMVQKVQYHGTVYCLTLSKNHTMLVKRNGKVFWSGNCDCTLLRFFPESQEYNPKTKAIEFSGGKEFLKYIPQDFLDEIDSMDARTQLVKDMSEADRAQDIHRPDSYYYKEAERFEGKL